MLKDQIISQQLTSFEPEKERLETQARIAELAKSYVNLPKEKLEPGIKNLLANLEKLPPQETQSAEFLKGMLNLEMYNYLKDLTEKQPKIKKEANQFLDQAFQGFSKIVEKKENFEIKCKVENNKEAVFGNLSLSYTYLGDICYGKYLEDNDLTKRIQGEGLYKEAIQIENDTNRRCELKTILAIKKIVENLGNENSVKCWKTTRREDFRQKAADLLLEYLDKQGKPHSKYIDITCRLTTEKSQKKDYSPTSVMVINEDNLDDIINLDFNNLSINKEEMATQPRIVAKKFRDTFIPFGVLFSKLADSLGLREIERPDFAANFFMNEDKLSKLLPLDRKTIIEIRSHWW